MTEAIRWLERAKADPDAVAADLRGETHPERARSAALALRAAGPAGAAALRSALVATLPSVRGVVVEALALLPGGAGVDALVDHLSREPDPWVRRAVVRGAARAGVAEARLLGWARTGPVEVAVEALRAGRDRRGALDAWVEVARARLVDVDGSFVGTELVWHVAVTTAAAGADGAPLGPWRTSPSPFVRAQVAAALASDRRCEASWTFEAVWRLRDTDPDHLADAARAAVEAEDPAVIRAALGRLAASDATTDGIADAARHPLPEVRRVALAALDRRAAPSVWRALGAVLADEPEPELRVAALFALGRRSEPESLAVLLDAVGDPPDPAVVGALATRVRRSARGRTPAVRDVLARAASAGAEAVAVEAVDALARFPPADVAHALDGLAAHARGPVAAAVARARAGGDAG